MKDPARDATAFLHARSKTAWGWRASAARAPGGQRQQAQPHRLRGRGLRSSPSDSASSVPVSPPVWLSRYPGGAGRARPQRLSHGGRGPGDLEDGGSACQPGATVVVTGERRTRRWSCGPAGLAFTDKHVDKNLGIAGRRGGRGHVLECGAQATGGNYAFFAEVPGLRPRRASRLTEQSPPTNTSVITESVPGASGLVSVGTR